MERTVYEDDHEAFRGSCAAFLANHARPNLDEYIANKAIDRQFWEAAGAQDLLGLEIPEEYGGVDAQDYRFNAVWAEELSKVNAALATCAGIHGDIVA